MAAKRKYNLDELNVDAKKHTLDSDEEDSDEYEKEDADDFEGEEDGIPNIRDDVKITPFNMREELQEGHFDKEGHYHWDKDNEIRDNWLDNIDWIKVDENSIERKQEESTSDINTDMDEQQNYTKLLSYMERHETVSQTLCRLGQSRRKMSTAERLRNKKVGVVDNNAQKIFDCTELANRILTKTGNMDVYQLTYETIQDIVAQSPSTSSEDTSVGKLFKAKDNLECHNKHVLWEFKWNQKDSDLQGPYSTTKMLELSRNGHFKNGVYVRKIGEKSNFYSSSRIDFDLYL